jgi:catechol 2,3-dioxygenase-like lactoylglutathione lyase family enzyme
MMAILEHANVTVTDPAATAAWLGEVFGWHIRWHGEAIHGGTTYHVGGADSYVALYTPSVELNDGPQTYTTQGALNHIGVVVDDLDAAEARVAAQGFKPHNHADYEPGRRFYFRDGDGVEWEVVSYR